MATQRPEILCIFVTLSPLLSAIITAAVSRHADLRLLANFKTRDDLAHLAAVPDADLVVIGLRPGESDAIAAPLLLRAPRTKFLLISGSGDYAYLVCRGEDRIVLFDFSPDKLLKLLLDVRHDPKG